MSSEENKGSDIGLLFMVLGLLFVGFLLIAVLIPKQITSLFISLNSSIEAFFNSPLYLTAKLIAGLLTVLLAALITWLFFKLLEMEKEHEEHVYHHAHTDHHDESHSTPHDTRTKTSAPPAHLPGLETTAHAHEEEKPGKTQWQSVLRLASSSNPSDWKLAIIEADVLLDTMTYMQGFEGDTLGERLRNTDVGLFQTIKYARHAHGLRNRIAHTPDMTITERDLNQTIKMYEAVFTEFSYI